MLSQLYTAFLSRTMGHTIFIFKPNRRYRFLRDLCTRFCFHNVHV